MRSALLTGLMLVTPMSLACQAPNFAGSFAMASAEGGQIVVTLQSAGAGNWAGTMSNGGLTWQLRGDTYEDALTGTVDTGQGMLAFEAYIYHDELEFILVQIGPDGMPDVDNGQEFIFTRTGTVPQGEDNIVEQPYMPWSPPGTPQSPAASDPFTGTFSNGEMTLQLQGGNGSYSGQAAVGAEAFPVVVQMRGSRMEGTMNAANGQYGFYLTATDSGVNLDSAGEIFSLSRVDPARAGPNPQQPSPAPQTPEATMPGAQGRNTPPNSAPLPAGVSDSSPLAQQWRQVLAGKKVTYISSYSSNTLGGGGTSQKNVFHLCSDGQFAFSENGAIAINPGAPDIGTPGVAGGGGGSWRIITQGQLAGIELRFNDGDVVHYQLTMQNGEVYANSDRVYVTPGEVCY